MGAATLEVDNPLLQILIVSLLVLIMQTGKDYDGNIYWHGSIYGAQLYSRGGENKTHSKSR